MADIYSSNVVISLVVHNTPCVDSSPYIINFSNNFMGNVNNHFVQKNSYTICKFHGVHIFVISLVTQESRNFIPMKIILTSLAHTTLCIVHKVWLVKPNTQSRY